MDLTLSVRSALDLKELLEQLSASNETLAHIGARLEETASFLAQSTQDARRKLGEVQEQLRDATEQRGAALARKKEAGLTALETRLAARREKKSRFMEFLERRTAQALNDAQTRLPQAETAEEREKLEHLVEELSGFDSLLARSCASAERQWTLGLKTREEALRNLSDSYASPLFERVVDGIVRSLHFGSSLAESLESAASEARIAYRTRKQEQVAKAPVKMMIPTGTLMLPAMLILVMGPVMLELMGGF